MTSQQCSGGELMLSKTKVVIMGAAGRDFHNFNVHFRDNDTYEVVAFTATQIPGIESRLYPPELSGSKYPEGISIYPEEKLSELIKEYDVDQVVFASAMFHTNMLCIRLLWHWQTERTFV